MCLYRLLPLSACIVDTFIPTLAPHSLRGCLLWDSTPFHKSNQMLSEKQLELRNRQTFGMTSAISDLVRGICIKIFSCCFKEA